MTENNYNKLIDVVCELVNLAWDSTSKEEFERLDNGGADIIDCLEKLQQFEAICTIEEFKRAKEMEAVYGQVKWERDIAISQLEEIGVSLGQKMDEFKALKEKSVAKKPKMIGYRKDGEPVHECGCCGNTLKVADQPFCMMCSCKIDWQ